MTQTSDRTIPLQLVSEPPPAQTGRLIQGVKQLGAAKIAATPRQFAQVKPLPKPEWIRVRLPTSNAVQHLKSQLRRHQLVTVCEQASCPNIHECFAHGTATFLILGDICTRRCAFCDVAHGRPAPPDAHEPQRLATVIAQMRLQYVVITSVDRDDLQDGGAGHFVDCLAAIRQAIPEIQIEILTPDFRGKGRMERALTLLAQQLPDVFNHNIETVPSQYPWVRPGADYHWSLKLLQQMKQRHSHVLTKSGLMLGLGETVKEVQAVLQDLKEHQVDLVTIGQYLQPTPHHHPVLRYWPVEEFTELARFGEQLGLRSVIAGPMVRSSYHADRQAAQARGVSRQR